VAGALAAKLAEARARWPFVDVLARTTAEAKLDGERRLAAEVTYYAFFSLFPLLMVFVTILEAAFGQENSDKIVDSVLEQFPVIGGDIAGNVGSPQGQGLAAAVGLVLALWAGSHAFESFEHAITVIWKGPAVAPTSMVKSRIRAFATMGILGVAILVTTVVGSVLATIDLLPWVVKPGTIIVSVALNTGVILLVFKVLAPGHPSWRSQLPGALVGAVGWTVLQSLGAYFIRYVIKGASDTYGTFAAVIGLLTWINIQIRLILYAAELNSVMATVEPEPAH
jgi:membrane protein